MKLTITALLFAHMAAAAPSISLGGVANAASFQPILTRGSLATIAGADLAPLAMSATQFPLPTTLAGVRVSINGIDAPLLYVSPVQINFQVPFEVPADGSAFLTVVTDGTTSLPVAVALNDNAPGIFTHLRTPTSRDPVIIHLDGQLVTPDRPGRPSEILIGFATGIGSLINAPATGAAAPVTPLASARVTPVITVGGAPVEVLYAGLAPGYAGLLQLNFRLPATLPPGQRLPLAIRSGGSVSNPVDLAVQASGLIPQPAVEVSPSSLQFGDVTVGQSRSLVVTFRNTGTGDLLIQSIVSGNAQFAAQLAGTALRIDPGAQQSVTIRYTPAVAGAAFASLAVTTNDPARPVLSIPVTGTGLTGVPAGPVLEATPPSVDFGAVNIGFTTSRTVNIRNAGGMPLNISSITSSSPVFSPPAPNLPLTLAAGAQQTVLLRYTPTTPGAQSAMLTILSNDPNRPQMNVTLTGTGSIQTSSVEVTPASLDFGA
ncbi:MAG TPA: choice-of-anchor D domain-containing protein, partial [Bryobacteraceae bacterium]|nr:choice-of-anchor D domain-containing protein [Bryobacteraceae bacterium]